MPKIAHKKSKNNQRNQQSFLKAGANKPFSAQHLQNEKVQNKLFMKTKIKLLARLLMVTLLFSFMGCSEDVYENHVHNKPIPLKNNISFEQFKRETGLSKFDTKIKINQNVDTVLNRNADGSYELSDFNIATNIIKRVDFDEKITYTFQIKPVVEVANGHFYNLTMFYKEGWQSLITELIPSVEHALELQQGTEEKFEGTMARLYQSDLPPNSVEACTTIFIYFSHCTNTDSCATTGICDGCSECVTTDVYTTCSTDPVGTSIEYIDLGGSTGGSGSADGATEPPFGYEIVIDPNLTDRSVFDDPNYINQVNASSFLSNLDYNQQQWVNNNLDTYNQLIQHQIANEWSVESKQFAKEMIDFYMERDWKAEIKQAISTGITSSAELTHKMYSKLSAIAINHPSSISYINIVIDGVRAAASTVIDTNPNTCNWTDLFNMWMFELGNNPLNFNGPSVTVTSLQSQQGVSQARSIALNQIANGDLNPIPPHGWTYGQQAFYNGMANGNIATSFLGSYTTNVTITVLPNGHHMLTFTVTNPSTWDSATRLRIDNNGDGVHDGIFPNHERNAPNTLHIGGNFNQIWTWTETY